VRPYPPTARLHRLRLGALGLVFVALVVAGCGGGRPGGAAEVGGGGSQEVSFDKSGWKTDFSRHAVPLSEFMSGGPPRDGIPPIDQPETVSISQADRFLSAREPVIAVEVNGRPRAYPIQILVWHEIVNDTLGGAPVAVTYCPLCNSALVFDRRVAGRTLTFGTTGNLRRSDLVMWDRQTESWWQQIDARAVVGKLTGTRLKPLPAQTLSWDQFKRSYPTADVLSRDTGFNRDYGTNPYTSYDRPDVEPFLYEGPRDTRLPPKERVVAVQAGSQTVVVPFSVLRRRPVVATEVGGRPVVIFYARGVASALDRASIADSRDVGTAGAFDPRVGGRTLSFRSVRGGFVDEQTGSRWNIAGQATGGPLRGRRLSQVRHGEQFWFAIAAFLPNAKLLR
jgi:hypothetical protein